jgi:6-phosphogluconate dehydrogenase
MPFGRAQGQSLEEAFVESASKAKIGLIGLGLMGRPMGMNLLKAGHRLTVWNRTPSRREIWPPERMSC